MSGNITRDQELLDLVKNQKVQVRIEDVEKMVMGFPLTPVPFDWSTIINLNSILMTSVSAFIIAGSFMLYTADGQVGSKTEETPSTITEQALGQQQSEMSAQYSIPTPEETEETAIPPVATVQEEEPSSTATSQEPSSSPEPETLSVPEEPELLVEEGEAPIAVEFDDVIDEVHIEVEYAMADPAPFVEERALPEPLAIDEDEPEILDEKKTYNLSGFNSVSLAGSFDVEISQGEQFEVWAEGSDKKLEKLDAEVKGNTLKLTTKGNYGNKKDCSKTCDDKGNGSSSLKVHITMPVFESLAVSGSGSMLINSFSDLGGVNFSIAGSGEMNVEGHLEMSGHVKCNISGSGDMNIDGNAPDAEVHIAGSGDFHGLDLRVAEADIHIAGSGDVGIYAEQELEVSIAGSGDVVYEGTPTIRQSIVGSGDIHRN